MAGDTGGWDYVAIEPINFEGVRAYNVGDLVHADAVEAHGYLEENLVEKLPADVPAKAVQTPPPANNPPGN